MIRVSMLLAVLAIFAAVVEAQAQQVVSSAKKVSQGPEITEYPKYPIEYPADWKGPKISETQVKPAATAKTAARTTAFRKTSNTIKVIPVTTAAKSANTVSNQSNRVITNKPISNYQPTTISPSYNRYPSFYSPPGCLTGR